MALEDDDDDDDEGAVVSMEPNRATTPLCKAHALGEKQDALRS
jgi:hypothetical protein